MKIGILGTGGVGKAFASKLTALGHQVMLGTRDVKATMEKTGEGTISALLAKTPAIKLGSFAEAASFAELIIHVAKGANALDVLKSAGEKNIADKILIDISNPLDFSKGMPPCLIPQLSNTNSLGEEIQRLFPKAKLVKTLNTMWNGLMLDPKMLNNGEHINYISGNDEASKQKVKNLLSEFGWKESSIFDLGDITAARATESLMPIWLRVYGVKKTGAFNFQILS